MPFSSSRTLILSLLLTAAVARAETAPAIVLNHSGRLLTQNDAPMTSPVTLKFELHTRSSAIVEDTKVWTDTWLNVPLDATGAYALRLGDTLGTEGAGHVALAPSHFEGDRWLAVSVNDQAVLPWLRIGTVPAAAFAGNAAKLGGEDPASFHDASKLVGVAPAAVLGTGSAALTTVGTIAAGTWQGTAVADAYVAGAAAWNAKLAGVAHDGTLSGDGKAGETTLKVNVGSAAGSVAAGDDARFGQWSGTSTGLVAATARTSLGLGTSATTDAAAYATAAQGTKADAALARGGGALTGALTGTTAAFTGNLTTGGVLQTAGAGAPCVTANAGSIRWTGTVFQGCNGVSWGSLTQQPPNSVTNPGRTCLEILNSGQSIGDGLYWVSPTGLTPSQVTCDMTSGGLQSANFTGATYAQSSLRGGFEAGRSASVFWVGGGDGCCFNSGAGTNQWTQVTLARSHKFVKMTGAYNFSGGFYGAGFPVLLQGFDGSAWQTVHTFSTDVTNGVTFTNPGFYTVYRMFLASNTSYWHLYPSVDQFKALILP